MAGWTFGQLKASFDLGGDRLFGADKRFIHPTLRDQWINEAYQQLCRELRWPREQYEVTTTQDISSYEVPARIRRWEVLQYADTNDNNSELAQLSISEWIDRLGDGSARGRPTHYLRDGETLYLWPTPDTTDETVTIWAAVEAANLSEESETPGFAADLHQLILRLATAYALEFLGRFEEAAQREGVVLGRLAGVKRDWTLDRGRPARVENRGV